MSWVEWEHLSHICILPSQVFPPLHIHKVLTMQIWLLKLLMQNLILLFFDASDLLFSCFVFFHSVLYSERLKQWGYWFILCLHQIPFTFEMLFAWKTKLLCPNKEQVICGDERSKQHTGQARCSEDRYRCPAESNSSVVQHGVLEFLWRKVEMCRRNQNGWSSHNSNCFTKLQTSKAPVCHVVMEADMNWCACWMFVCVFASKAALFNCSESPISLFGSVRTLVHFVWGCKGGAELLSP